MIANSLRILSTICVSILLTTTIIAQTGLKIAKIEAEGLQTVTSETVIATSGLKIGDPFSEADTDAAAERLASSGLFKKVGYRTRYVDTSVTITFQLEELKGQWSPVAFDNFIWFSDEELATAIKRDVPTFNGSAPDAGDTTEAIKKALQNLLTERKLPGQVEYNLTENEHLFRVEGVPMKICTLHFPGSQSVPEDKLIQVTRSSMDQEYSRQSAKTFPTHGLYPIYSELGHLRASFGAPVAKPDSKSGCEGVDLTIPVNEGPKYSWAKAEWSGNQVLEAPELDGALGMKPGEVANGKKLDKGLTECKKAYGKSGHIQTRMSPTPEFDDAASKVTFKIAVNEGPQYRMGTVEFKGFSPADAATLSKRWALKSGEVYDQTYSSRFFRDEAREITTRIASERESQGKPLPNIDTRETPNRQTLIVNLTIELKN
ncbi:MAG TPA: FtsQ-type POTRA domain-containing protein [Pyrinomonadaceae bacterium]|nr:FtsQ-type POTRA domain-containing protein [Pyrinomonadaceae bacterium]